MLRTFTAPLRTGENKGAWTYVHKLPVKASVRKAIGKQAGDTVRVELRERLR